MLGFVSIRVPQLCKRTNRQGLLANYRIAAGVCDKHRLHLVMCIKRTHAAGSSASAARSLIVSGHGHCLHVNSLKAGNYDFDSSQAGQ